MVGLKALFIIGIVFLVLLLLAQLRLGVGLEKGETTLRLWVKIGPWNYTVYPASLKKEKKSKEAKKSKKKKAKQPKAASSFKEGLSVDILREYLDLLREATSRFRRKILVEKLEIRLRWGMGDPAQTAITYGYAHAVLGGLMGIVEESLRIKERKTEILLDYSLEQTMVELRILCSLTLWQMLCLGAFAGRRGLRTYGKHKKKITKKDGTIKRREKAVNEHGTETSN